MKIKQSEISLAHECFVKYGYHKTSVEELSNSMGLSLSTLYNNYESKEMLFKIIIAKEIDQFKFLIKNAVEKNNDPIEKLYAFIVTRIIGVQKMKVLFFVSKDERLSKRYLSKRVRLKSKTEEEKCLQDILQLGIENGIFQIEDIHLKSCVILSAINSLTKSINQYPDLTKSEERLFQFFTLLLFGIIKD